MQFYCNQLPGDDMTSTDAPELDGIHHVKLPVSDLSRSRAWYESRLGYRVSTEFIEDGAVLGLALAHPNGGPDLALRLNPELAARAAGFDYFAIGVPTKAALESLAERLTALGEQHAGVHFAPSAGSCRTAMTRTATRSASTPPSTTPTRTTRRSGRCMTRWPPPPPGNAPTWPARNPDWPVGAAGYVHAMAIAQFKDLCLDAVDPAGLGQFYAAVLEPQHGTRTWTVMADPEGNEFCAFTR